MTSLVLFPGMMCDARLFMPQIVAIKDRAVTIAPITAYDTVEELAADVLLHAPAHFALAGLSMGGIVAMEVVRQAPQRVERLCLMDTNPLAEDKAVSDRREPQIEKVAAGKLAAVMREEMKPNYLADGAKRSEILDICMHMALELGGEVFIRQSRALQRRPDQTRTLQQYKKPALVLHGVDDRLCPAHHHELMCRLMPQAVYGAIDGAGHLPTLEQPQAVNQLLADWLGSS